MFITEEYVKSRFEEYNNLLFEGNLPMIPIGIERLKAWGEFRAYGVSSMVPNSSCCIIINSKWELQRENWNDVIIHEMIHYYQWYWGIKGRPHGKLFKSLMKEFNERYGRNVDVRYYGPYISMEIGGETHYAIGETFCVAMFVEHGGMTSLKRLSFELEPREAFLQYAKDTFDRKKVQIVFTNNPYFSNLPVNNGMLTTPVQTEDLKRILARRPYKTKVYDVDIV